jgi:pyruvate ferredoxin oxidoreductase alpha subunit
MLKRVILEVAEEFEKLTGRKYGFFEEYRMDDAEVAVVVMNSTAGTAKTVVDELREQGVKAGLIKPRVFRPFPFEEIGKALSGLKAVASHGQGRQFLSCRRSVVCRDKKRHV